MDVLFGLFLNRNEPLPCFQLATRAIDLGLIWFQKIWLAGESRWPVMILWFKAWFGDLSATNSLLTGLSTRSVDLSIGSEQLKLVMDVCLWRFVEGEGGEGEGALPDLQQKQQ